MPRSTACSRRAERNRPAGEADWSRYCASGAGIHALDLTARFSAHLDALLARIGPAIQRPATSPVTEDYTVFRVERFPAPHPDIATVDAPAAVDLREEDIVRLLLNEVRPLSPDARRELLPHRFSYYPCARPTRC